MLDVAYKYKGGGATVTATPRCMISLRSVSGQTLRPTRVSDFVVDDSNKHHGRRCALYSSMTTIL
eukprot:4144561-Pyramimonas_sp.AAC.1